MTVDTVGKVMPMPLTGLSHVRQNLRRRRPWPVVADLALYDSGGPEGATCWS